MTNVNVLVLYYSSYGHIELMAQAQAEGAARISQARVAVKRVPETGAAGGRKGIRVQTRSSRHPLPPQKNSIATMRSFLARRPGSATWPRRCGTSSTRRERYGARGALVGKIG